MGCLEPCARARIRDARGVRRKRAGGCAGVGNCARTCQIEQAVQPRDDRGRSDTPVPVPRKSADVSGIRRPRRTPRARRVHRARVRVLETTRTGAWSRARRGSARASPGSGRAVRVVVRSGKLERTTRPRALGDDRHGRRVERRARPRARGRPRFADAFVLVRVVLVRVVVRPRRHPPRARVLRPPPVARPTGTPRAPHASSPIIIHTTPGSSSPPSNPRAPSPRAVEPTRTSSRPPPSSSAASGYRPRRPSPKPASTSAARDVDDGPTPRAPPETPPPSLLTPPPIVVARPRRRRRVARANDASRRTRGVGATRVNSATTIARDSRVIRLGGYRRLTASTSRTRAVTRDTRDSSPATAKC